MTLLSVIVPTVPGRESLLSRCLYSITEQAAGGDVEILVVEGTGKLGDKVNAAVRAAAGEYVTVVDDDDWLAACYMAEVLPLCREGPDYVGLRVAEMCNGLWSRSVVTTGEQKSWGDKVRAPVPKGVTRIGIARQVTFSNDYFGDRAWSADVSALVRTWRLVNRNLYFYDYWQDASAFTGSGRTRDVGTWPFDWSLVRRCRVD